MIEKLVEKASADEEKAHRNETNIEAFRMCLLATYKDYMREGCYYAAADLARRAHLDGYFDKDLVTIAGLKDFNKCLENRDPIHALESVREWGLREIVGEEKISELRQMAINNLRTYLANRYLRKYNGWPDEMTLQYYYDKIVANLGKKVPELLDVL